MAQHSPNRFEALDALRGAAALTVVLSHWNHFYRHGSVLDPAFNPRMQPLYEPLKLFYQHGWLAVDLFFALSGFIFYWLYGQVIAERRVGAGEFALRRFSRLYPLHLATLLLVAVGQVAMVSLDGNSFVYTHNDGYHALLNLLLVNDWGFAQGYSFNGPVWSVSTEMALYLVFFVACRYIGAGIWVPLVGALVGLVMRDVLHTHIARGICSFFFGALAYFAYRHLSQSKRDLTLPLAAAAALLWILTIAGVYAPLDGRAAGRLARLGSITTVAMLFPLTILALALLETRFRGMARRVAFLGDISYSSYLLHFPLQLAVALGVIAWHIDRSVYASPLFMLGFFAVLITLSRLSHRWLEMPAQRAIRQLASQGSQIFTPKPPPLHYRR
jgi:peptidoglycan/LPS O-acetylase OafA/YrhL